MSEPEVTSYEIGEEVYCHAFGHWYKGTVKKFGRTKIHIEYTSGSGKTRIKPCSPDQISKDKPEGKRGGRRARYIERVDEPEMVRQEHQISQIDAMRLISAFQVLSWPSGFYRGTTHKRAREVIEEVIGIRLKRNAKPDRSNPPEDLQGYVDWASNPDLQHPIYPDEESGLLPGSPLPSSTSA